MTTYAIVFKGELRDGFIRDAVMAAFKERANLGDAQIQQVFSGRTVTLKKGLSRDAAKQFARELRAIGMRIIAAAEGGAPAPAPAEPPAPGTHHILFAGRVADGFDAEAVKLTAAKRLKFSERQADLLFSGKEVTMKRGLSEEKARHYAATLRKLGMEVRVEPPLPAPPEEDAAIVQAEASLVQTQLAPVTHYNFEETFHSSSTLEMLNGDSADDDPMAGIHPSLLAPPTTPEPPGAADPTRSNTHLHADTVVNHDLIAAYADALNESDTDPEIEALRAAHDNAEAPQTMAAPFNITPEPPLPDPGTPSPFDAGTAPTPAAPETVMSPLDEPAPDITAEPAPATPPIAARGRATESLMPADENDPELLEIRRAAEEKRKWVLAGTFVMLVAIIAVWALT